MINEMDSNINVIRYKIEHFETVDSFSEQMLKTNPIAGIVPIGKQDDEFLIPISNYKKLDDYLKENVTMVDEVIQIINQLDALVKVMDNYMLPVEELILDYDYAFMDGDILTFMLIPTNYSHLHSHTKKEFITLSLLAPIYRTDDERLKAFETIQGPCLPQMRVAAENLKEKKKLKEKKELKEKKKQSRLSLLKEKLFSSGEDDIFDFPTEEILPQGIHVIIVRSTKAEYPLLFGPDYIGTDPTVCSICFAGNATMSAEHCVITLARGHYFVADLNSRSGTLLNGQPLEPGKTYELHSADLITVAGEELVFSKRG